VGAERWEIARLEYGSRPESTGWEPFGVEGGLVYWRRGPERAASPVTPGATALQPRPLRPVTGGYLSCSQVAELLGAHVATVRKWSRSGELPKPVRIGGAFRWRRADVEGLIGGARSDADAPARPTFRPRPKPRKA
jgi:excisionase family DNA binding protein